MLRSPFLKLACRIGRALGVQYCSTATPSPGNSDNWFIFMTTRDCNAGENPYMVETFVPLSVR